MTQTSSAEALARKRSSETTSTPLPSLLTQAQVAKLDAASAITPPYPFWQERAFERNPPPV